MVYDVYLLQELYLLSLTITLVNNKETKIHKAKIRRTIREKKKYIIIVRHINIGLRIFYQVQKKIRIGTS